MRMFLLTLPLIFLGCTSDNGTAVSSKPQAQPQVEQPAPAAPRQEEAPAKTAEPAPQAVQSAPVETVVPAPKPEAPAQAAPQEEATSLSGETLFKLKCASCHGMKAEKSALTKSEVIAGWDVKRISDAIHGYKAGSYGRTMKTLMQAQVKALSDEDISVLANYISAQ